MRGGVVQPHMDDPGSRLEAVRAPWRLNSRDYETVRVAAPSPRPAEPERRPPPTPHPREEGVRRGLRLLVCSVLGRLLLEERLVDVRDDAAAGDGRLDQRVELLVAADGQLEVARRDPLDAQVLGRVAGELEHLGGEVLEDGGGVDGRGRADAPLVGHPLLEVAVDPADRELEARLGGARDGLLGLELGGITLDLGRHGGGAASEVRFDRY
mmetsp:Transcript_35498/g.114488  ORF Transcript_35498/g.114488 Transcript_35498/m.114488 type:complete len:211 (+) Transcript_35498:150-782(+)